MRRLTAAALVLCGLIAGCGSSGGSSTTSTSANGVETQSADQIVADAANALSGVHSFHVSGTTQSGGTAAITGDFSLPGKFHLTIQQGASQAQVIVVDGAGYLNGNAAFYTQLKSPPQVTALFANRWIKAPQSSLSQFATFAALTDPKTLGHCLVQSHLGTLSVGGSSSVNGQPAVIVVDAGDVPGSAPGKLWVATTGEPLPLRLQSTGTTKPGGTPDAVCHETAADIGSTSGNTDLTISNYNAPVTITAPAGAEDLQQLLKASGAV